MYGAYNHSKSHSNSQSEDSGSYVPPSLQPRKKIVSRLGKRGVRLPKMPDANQLRLLKEQEEDINTAPFREDSSSNTGSDYFSSMSWLHETPSRTDLPEVNIPTINVHRPQCSDSLDTISSPIESVPNEFRKNSAVVRNIASDFNVPKLQTDKNQYSDFNNDASLFTPSWERTPVGKWSSGDSRPLHNVNKEHQIIKTGLINDDKRNDGIANSQVMFSGKENFVPRLVAPSVKVNTGNIFQNVVNDQNSVNRNTYSTISTLTSGGTVVKKMETNIVVQQHKETQNVSSFCDRNLPSSVHNKFTNNECIDLSQPKINPDTPLGKQNVPLNLKVLSKSKRQIEDFVHPSNDFRSSIHTYPDMNNLIEQNNPSNHTHDVVDHPLVNNTVGHNILHDNKSKNLITNNLQMYKPTGAGNLSQNKKLSDRICVINNVEEMNKHMNTFQNKVKEIHESRAIDSVPEQRNIVVGNTELNANPIEKPLLNTDIKPIYYKVDEKINNKNSSAVINQEKKDNLSGESVNIQNTQEKLIKNHDLPSTSKPVASKDQNIMAPPASTTFLKPSVQNRPVKSALLVTSSKNRMKSGADDAFNKQRISTIQQHLYVNNKSYLIISSLGKGGSSEVFLVLEEKSTRLLAVKCVNLSQVEKVIADSYLNEVQLLLRLQECHSVIRMFDHEYVEDEKMLYVVMEKGDTDLSRLLHDISKTKKIHMTMVLYYWTEMLCIVKEIHDRGIIHSDLKPANFLLVKGRLKLIDFGIASSLQGDMTSVHKDIATGTWNYMSPEAIKNNNSSVPGFKINYKSDVWSLGCILYNLVYGKTPFSHITTTFCKLTAIVNPNHEIAFPEEVESRGRIPPILLKTMKNCLLRDPKARPSVKELLEYEMLANSVDVAPEKIDRIEKMADQVKNTLPPEYWEKVAHVFAVTSLSTPGNNR